MARIGVIGTGEIAGHMVRGLAGQGHEIRVSERSRALSKSLAAEFPEVTVAENAAVVAESDVIFLCLLARVVPDILPGLPWRADQAVISVMTDVTLDDLGHLCAPAREIALTIPLAPISGGGCPLPVYPESPALAAVFGDRNRVFPVRSEAALNAHFAAGATLAPILRLMAEASAWLARETGDAEAAEGYILALFSGFLRSDGKPEQFQRLLASLSTEGGLNATLRARFEDSDVPDLLRSGMDSLRPRLGLPPAASE
jgi:pyrroline-5-carboxylate reductase